jgi:hypothetical protein
MSDRIQALLASAEYHAPDQLWDGKPNAWIRNLGTRASARTVQLLASLALEGHVVDDDQAGFKVVSGEKKIEIKHATLGLMSGYPTLMWQRVALPGEYTHLCLLAVYPEDARLFVVPKEEIVHSDFSPLRGSQNLFQLTTRRPDKLWPWLVRHELL